MEINLKDIIKKYDIDSLDESPESFESFKTEISKELILKIPEIKKNRDINPDVYDDKIYNIIHARNFIELDVEFDSFLDWAKRSGLEIII